jgi:hypothetical protein
VGAVAREVRRAGGAIAAHAPAPGALHSLHLDEPSGRAVAVAIGSAAAAAAGVAAIHYIREHVHEEDEEGIDDTSPYRLVSLRELRRDAAALERIRLGLAAEWGPFAPADEEAMRLLAENAGALTFVLLHEEDGETTPVAVLQTARAPAGGDPERLQQLYPSFLDLTSHGTWAASPRMKGDTAVLLQITTLTGQERSRGAGSLLRDAALYALPRSVHWALTTTPVEGRVDPEGDPAEYPAAVRFHYRGGARPAGYAAGYKAPPDGEPGGRQQHPNVVFMRYERLPSGEWRGVRRPALRLGRRLPGPGPLLRSLPIPRAGRPAASPLPGAPAS